MEKGLLFALLLVEKKNQEENCDNGNIRRKKINLLPTDTHKNKPTNEEHVYVQVLEARNIWLFVKHPN